MKSLKKSSLLKRVVDVTNYFGSHSNLHGVGYVFSLSYIPNYKRLCWFLILLGSGWGSFIILHEVLSVYTQASVSYSVETNYLSWDTPFPAVTLCEQLNTDRMKSYLAAKKFPISMVAFFKDVFYYNNQQCKQCTNCKNTTCVENYLGLVKDYRLKCEEMLNKCWWAGKPYNCCELYDKFHPLDTEYGPCFTFNSRLTNGGSLRYINRRTGLSSLVFTAIQSIAMRIHAPDDMVSVKVEKILKTDTMPLVSELNATLKAEAITSDTSIRRLDPERRGCLLERERPAFAHLWPFSRYSYSACVLYCRAMIQLDLCNCTHHFMVKLNVLQLNINCGCPMACEEINYKAVHASFYREPPPVSQELVARGSQGVVRLNMLPTLRVRRHAIRDIMALVGKVFPHRQNATFEGSNCIDFGILLAIQKNLKYRSTVVDLTFKGKMISTFSCQFKNECEDKFTCEIMDIGGVGGVFFGASLLSVIEIVYLFCIRRSS